MQLLTLDDIPVAAEDPALLGALGPVAGQALHPEAGAVGGAAVLALGAPASHAHRPHPEEDKEQRREVHSVGSETFF